MKQKKRKEKRDFDSRWRGKNNSGSQLSVNAQRVSQSRISRQIFVAHRTGKFPGIEETGDASIAILAVVAASAGTAAQRHSATLRTKHSGPGALLNQQSEIWEGRLAYPSD